MVAAIVTLAQHGDASALTDLRVPDDGVWLGLGESLLIRRSRDELSDPAGWMVNLDGFRARVGPFSALDVIAGTGGVGGTSLTVGPHSRCASPPGPAPEGFSGARQVSLQPVDMRSCLDWWSVDLFFGPDGELIAVTLDLFEP